MMQRFTGIFAGCLVWVLSVSSLWAEVFTLEDGTTYEGEVAALDDEGLVVRLKIGGFSERIDLVYLDQDTLKALAQEPKYQEHVEVFIELDEKEYQPPEIIVHQPERIARPEVRSSFIASLASPMGFLALAVLMLANLWAAYEVAIYRQRAIPLVCGLSLVLPVLGPIFFLSMPAHEVYGNYDDGGDDADFGEGVEAPVAQATSHAPQSKLGLSQQAGHSSGGGGGLEGAVFTKDDTTFNRSFFETTFTEFFRVVPSAAIKGLVIEIRTVKQEYVIKRVSRISAGDLHAQLLQGGKEVSIRFGEVIQVSVRAK